MSKATNDLRRHRGDLSDDSRQGGNAPTPSPPADSASSKRHGAARVLLRKHERRAWRCRARIKVREHREDVSSYKIWRRISSASERCAGVAGAICYLDPKTGGVSNTGSSCTKPATSRASFRGRDGRVGARVPLDYKPADRPKYIDAFLRISMEAVDHRCRRPRYGSSAVAAVPAL